MKKVVLLISVIVFIGCNCKIDTVKDVEEIKAVLHKSAEDWSNGDIKAFMDAYWKSEELQFIGKNGITY